MNKFIWILCLGVVVAGCESGSGEPKVAGRWYAQTQVDQGRRIYTENCIACHKEDAQGTANWKEPGLDGSYPPPPLNGSAHAWHHPLGVLMRVIDDGGVPLGGKMPAFKDKLKEEEMLAAISYFQSFWSDEIYSAWIKRGGLE